jgi:regulator of protease activity HflC (stomatin/prohibitin superfamily)
LSTTPPPGGLERPLRAAGPAQPGRPASVTLRVRGEEDDAATQLDPANQSLADALGLVFRGLQFAMLLLAAAFLLSGLGSVKANESGVKLLFGRKVQDDLKPGFAFSWPYPIGDLKKVDRGNQTLDVSEAFWPRLMAEQTKLSIEQLATQPKHSLKPGEDGSLITGDENIAHAQWTVQYRRTQPGNYLEHTLETDERDIVQAAVQRGIVQAVGQVRIDDLLKQSASDQGSVAQRARAIAQATLDQIRSGIEIDQIILQQKAPPFSVYSAFSGVQSAEQKASQKRDGAQTQARNTLTAMAGAAHQPLIEQIDLYEEAVTRGDAEAQGKILAVIHDIFEGREAASGDTVVPRSTVSGEVTRILNDARQYRSTIVSQRRGELASFRAKLAQFKANPDLVVQREWADAMIAFLDRPTVEIMNVPAGIGSFDLWINRDPSFMKEYEQARKAAEIKLSELRRAQDFNEARFKTNTDQLNLQAR